MHKILLLILLGSITPIMASTPRAGTSTRTEDNLQRKEQDGNSAKNKLTWYQKAIENWKKVGIAILVALCCVAIALRAFFKQEKILLFTVDMDDKKFSFYSQTIIEDINTYVENGGKLGSLEKNTLLHSVAEHINSKNPTAWIQAINRIHELDPTFKNSQNKQRDTPLHIALRKGVQSNEIIELLTTDANKYISNNQGKTPLHIAVDQGRYDQLTRLC